MLLYPGRVRRYSRFEERFGRRVNRETQNNPQSDPMSQRFHCPEDHDSNGSRLGSGGPTWPEPRGSKAATAVIGSLEGLCRQGPGGHLHLGCRPRC